MATAPANSFSASNCSCDEGAPQADDTILEKSSFALEDECYKSFIAALEAPIKPDDTLRARMQRKPAWER